MDHRLSKKLNDRKLEGTLRSLSFFEGGADFFSNDYLGLAKVKFPESGLDGGTGSRLISGHSKEAADCEAFIASFFKSPAAMVFNSGYLANLSIFSCIPQRGDTVLYDQDIHASVRDGLRLGVANSFGFRHNDIEDLERQLKKAKGTKYVAIESLYSMKGDMGPFGAIVRMCEAYSATLIVDEAHAIGVFGEAGRGIFDTVDTSSIDILRVITFGKAYGSHGAAVLCSEAYKTFLVNFARPFIYTTALPPSTYSRIVEAVKWSERHEKAAQLIKNVQFFRSELKLPSPSEMNSPIQMVHIGDRKRLIETANQLKGAGINCKPIFHPTVPKENEGNRCCIHAFNSENDIKKMTAILRTAAIHPNK